MLDAAAALALEAVTELAESELEVAVELAVELVEPDSLAADRTYFE